MIFRALLILLFLSGAASAQSAVGGTGISPPASSSGGGVGCTPGGGSPTNIILYGTAGACNPALDANVTNGALTLGLANTTIGSLILEGSSSGAATITGGTNGTFTSASPWALSGLVTLIGASNALGTPLTLVLTNATGLPLTTGVTGILPVPNGGTGAATLTASGLVVAHGTSAFTALAEVDGDCVVGAAGAWTAASCPGGSGGTPANPTATAGPTANNGSATTYMRSDASPAVQKASNAQFGLAEGDGQSVCVTTGVAAACAPIRTAASPTVATTDMSGTVIISSGGITFPVISAGLFDNKQTLQVINYGGSAAAVTNSTGQTINNGGGCVVASGVPAGGMWQMQPNGTSIDCVQGVSASGGGSGTVNSGTTGQIAVYASSGTTVSGQTVASGTILKGQGAAVPLASAITDSGSNVSIAEAALTTPVGLTDGSTIATNAALSNVFSVTIAGNRTLSNPTNLVAGQFITWQITQDGTGSRTLAFGTDFAWLSGGAPLLNSAAAAKTTISCFVDTTSTLQCAGGAPLATVTTGSNCSSSAAPAVCASASAGSVAIPTGANPTLTINTTAVTANSQILLNVDESLGTKLSVTCNTTLTTLTNPVVTARTAGTSFTIQIGSTLVTNPACVSYVVIN